MNTWCQFLEPAENNSAVGCCSKQQDKWKCHVWDMCCDSTRDSCFPAGSKNRHLNSSLKHRHRWHLPMKDNANIPFVVLVARKETGKTVSIFNRKKKPPKTTKKIPSKVQSLSRCVLLLLYIVTDPGYHTERSTNIPMCQLLQSCGSISTTLPSQLFPNFINVLHLLLLEESHTWPFIDAQGWCN